MRVTIEPKADLEVGSEVRHLLSEGFGYARQAFGNGCMVRVEAVTPDLIKATVVLNGVTAEEAERMCRAFDDLWWRDNCHRAEGRLVFDYSLA